ncbi:dihydropteroate synthase [Helicobacter canis]|uniref:dihydropteroate synthase n=1 Tax=Helicobacter canis TaxID=29419 RepID=A0A377J387_9HELI|nr:dihydropteroate synthase [Helicobacter canis]STO96941.1 dihydropteroate synthase [Helicobacter canis]
MHCTRIAPEFLRSTLESIGADRAGAKIMRKKGEIFLFFLHDLSVPQLHILKQELLSVGGDLATPRDAILSQNPPYNALLIATRSQLERVIAKCRVQPFGLKLLSHTLQAHLDSGHNRDSALRDKAGSLWLASSIDTQVLSPCSPLHNPAFSSQNLESHSGFTETAENKTNPLESTFEKTAQKAQEIQTLQKADSSDTPIFATAKTMDCHATATQCLAMTEKSTASKKVDSSFSAQNAPTLSNSTKDSRIVDEKSGHSRSFFSKSGLCKPRKEIRLGCLSSGDEIPDSSPKAESPKTHKAIMAIINLTPDSFYAPSRHTATRAIESIQELLAQGARLIDIGAASSRPGSPIISAQEEIARLKEVCAYIKAENLNSKARFSIDTYNAKTAAYALESGFTIVNDVRALSDSDMPAVVRDFGADFILMHTKGTPETMASLAHYTHLINEVDEFFSRKLELLESNNVGEVILDIGFGFAKNSAQNLALIQHLAHFKHFGKRLLVGASQKSTIGEIIDAPNPHDRLSGTLSLHLLALQNGADIIRAHHYKEHSDMLKIFRAYAQPSLLPSDL